jgi:predicted enzyme related to lactoylglutathione lyase
LGIDDVADDPSVLVEAPGVEPRFGFQLVPESKVVKNRVHIDLLCDDLEAETARLVELGARVLSTTGPSAEWVVFADPEGNEFCVST